MNINYFDLKKTGLLFFDILNGYIPDPEPGKTRELKPWIQNAVRLGKAGRAAGLPVFFAKGNHRHHLGADFNRHQQRAYALAQRGSDKVQDARNRRR
jgi:nicotinamidase-related amidase